MATLCRRSSLIFCPTRRSIPTGTRKSLWNWTERCRHCLMRKIRVLDRGPGVPAGCEEKVFEKFYRAHDSLSSGIQGSGLGLTIARQNAAGPRRGRGFRISRRRGELFRLAVAVAKRSDSLTSKQRFWWCDDPHISLGLEEVLKSDGFDVATCNRGDEACDAYNKHRPALLVLDVMLPGASGYDICKQLRSKKGHNAHPDAHRERTGN